VSDDKPLNQPISAKKNPTMLHLSMFQRQSVSARSALDLSARAFDAARDARISMSVVVVGPTLEKPTLVSFSQQRGRNEKP
jgi:hypothetical protein